MIQELGYMCIVVTLFIIGIMIGAAHERCRIESKLNRSIAF